jgi:hypothetical protein
VCSLKKGEQNFGFRKKFKEVLKKIFFVNILPETNVLSEKRITGIWVQKKFKLFF